MLFNLIILYSSDICYGMLPLTSAASLLSRWF